MYEIHADCIGPFPLNFLFKFTNRADAIQLRNKLNDYRKLFDEWKELKPFRVWDSITQEFLKDSYNVEI